MIKLKANYLHFFFFFFPVFGTPRSVKFSFNWSTLSPRNSLVASAILEILVDPKWKIGLSRYELRWHVDCEMGELMGRLDDDHMQNKWNLHVFHVGLGLGLGPSGLDYIYLKGLSLSYLDEDLALELLG